MCGIAGIVDHNNAEVSRSLLESMGRAMSHRGPDDEGIYTDRNVGLVHRRLSIIDLETGHQPIANEDKSIWIITNGEIYNFLELKKDLEAKGHNFRTNSDAEVVLHAYEEYGRDDFLSKLRGMYALAIWNNNNKELVLARDRLGKKPLLWYEYGGKLVFASEFNALLQDSSVPRQVNFRAIYHYLSFLATPAPETAFKNINRLEPGRYLIYQNGKVTIKTYWKLNYLPKLTVDFQEAKQRVLDTLTDSVNLRMISDVPVGVLLSGGVDSSAIVALINKTSRTKIKTFSIGFEESAYNELPYARKIARYFKTDHEEYVVDPKALEILPELVLRYGEPYADSSAIPSYYVSKMASRQVKVVLNGDGGDEVFGGYRRHLANHLALKFSSLPAGGIEAIKAAAGLLSIGAKRESLRNAPARFLEAYRFSFEERYLRWQGMFSEPMKDELLSGSFKREIGDLNSCSVIPVGSKGLDAIDQILFTDTHFNLPNDLLVKMDIASMANSLEARSPLLDHKLVELVARLPSDMKINNFKLKFLLKELLKDQMPEKLIRKNKQGFAVPIGEWFRGPMRDFLKTHLLSGEALKRDYFKISVVERMINLHLSRKADYAHHLWILLMFELWHRKFIDRT